MGLDQYAYVANKANQREEYFEAAVWDSGSGEWIHPTMSQPQEIAYWRKHPNLHGWMEKLYHAKGGNGDFNGDELELTWEDIDMLEHDIKSGVLAGMNTEGFFFGKPADHYYKDQDLKFCIDAKAECFLGRKVFYNSSW
jgi:hypothetical protein